MKVKYEAIESLPELIRVALPEEAQKLYLEAYNQVWVATDETLTEKERDQQAHQAGWQAVEREYAHDEGTGTWIPRVGTDPGDQDDDDGLLEKLKKLVP